MIVLSVALLLLAFFGHMALWAAIVNRLHGFSIPRSISESLTLVMFLWTAGLPLGFLVKLVIHAQNPLILSQWFPTSRAWVVYVTVCWAVAMFVLEEWFRCRWITRSAMFLRYDRRRQVSLSPLASDKGEHHRMATLPGNAALKLDLVERAVKIPGLPTSLDGLVIVQLSDLHFTGRIGKSFFHHAIQLANEQQPDLVVITGDLVDKVRCLEWIPEILGRLQSHWGKYMVMGNHDKMVGLDRVRQAVQQAGLIDLSGRWEEVAVRDCRVVLIGNSLPWLRPAVDLSKAPAPLSDLGGLLRIALSHTPDQIFWARAQHIDLMFAGHTHGGQICLPWIGPVLTPSRWGIRYSSGVFHLLPTHLNVTRGISGKYPVRVNCTPEVVKFVLCQR